MKLLKFGLIISIFAAVSSHELNAYALFRNKKPQEEVGVVWIKHDKGKNYVLLARTQEHGELRGRADVYSFTELTEKDKMPANVKVFAKDDTVTIYERKSTAWHKPKYHRWTYSWVPMAELKKVAETAKETGLFEGVRVKTRMQETQGKNYEVELDPTFLQLVAQEYGDKDKKLEEQVAAEKRASIEGKK